jgi:kumamolisin
MKGPPKGYRQLDKSERHPVKDSKLVGPADEKEIVRITIIIRRRPDGESMPEHDFFLKTPPSQRRRMSDDDFATKYGASGEDLGKVTAFARENGLNVIETNPTRRTVVASGTVAQMNKAFGVELNRYEHDVIRHRGEEAKKESYRGRDGFIHIPENLHGIITGVFGLDNRNITKRNSADPPNTTPLITQSITKLYNFPAVSAVGQTIGIVSPGGGYQISDIMATFSGVPPTISDVSVDGTTNSGSADFETTQDICIASLAAPGAAIAVYFQDGSEKGWVDMLNLIAHPGSNNPRCSVISSSFYICDGDDLNTISNEGISTAFIDAVSSAFHDAAVQGVTVCIASGDTGSSSKVGGNPSSWGFSFKADGKAHVQYPASDPWVLAVGGTTIGNVQGTTFDEYVWNDPPPSDPSNWGTTGGGISDHFELPSYQNNAGVPKSVNDGHIGRGIPDVAANASLHSGYSGIIINGAPFIGNGTSASSPLWAGLIAIINAALGENIGFVNPVIYALGSGPFRNILPGNGPKDNSNSGITGYPASPGWDACTGWGSPNGTELLNALKTYKMKISIT